jgi:O-antigen/teichoic acid export membrane protein
MSNGLNYRFVLINVPNALNILIPIFLLPIVIGKTGLEEFGRVIFYQGLIGVALIISENGLNTIILSEIRENNASSIVFHTIFVKLVLSVLIFVSLVFFIPIPDVSLFLFLYFSVLGQALNVSYLYVFKRKEMHYTLCLLTLKCTALVLFICRYEEGVLIYGLFLGLTDFLIGFVSLVFSGTFKHIISTKINGVILKNLALRGMNLSKINLLTAGYSLAVPIYIKFFMGLEIVGIYGAIEKVYRGFCNISAPFNLILLGESRLDSVRDFFKMSQVRIFFGLFILTLITTGLFGEKIMYYLLNNLEYDKCRSAFLLSLLIPVVVFFSRMFVINFYVKRSLEQLLVPIYTRVFLVSIPINFFCIGFTGLTGSIIAVVLVEVFCLYMLQKNYLMSFQRSL